MSVSDAQFAAWLLRSNRDTVKLVEIDYVVEVAGAPVTRTLYLAKSTGYWTYTSAATDTPATTAYEDRVLTLPKFTRELDRRTLGGAFSISYGVLVLNNADRGLDAILRYAYDGSAVRFYMGDRSWAKADFRLIFTALGASIKAPDRTRIEFTIRDASSLLVATLSSNETVGGTGENADRPAPMPLGACHNVDFVLHSISPDLKYRYGRTNPGATEGQLAYYVRNRGVDLAGGWTDNGDGTVTLLAGTGVNGQITGDVFCCRDELNYDTYRTSDFFKMLAGELGGLNALSLFYGAHSSFVERDDQDFHLGKFVSDTENLRDALVDVAASANAFFGVRRDNTFSYGRIFPFNVVGSVMLALVEDDLAKKDAPAVEELIPLYDQVQCTGDRNWTPQTNLATSLELTPALQDRYQRKALTYPGVAPSGTTYAGNPRLFHKTLSKSPLIDTLISVNFDSDLFGSGELTTFASVYLKKFAAWVQLYDATFAFRAYTLELGDVVTFTLAAYGLDAGPRMQVAGITIDIDAETVDLTLAHRQEASTGTTTGSYLKQLNGDYLLTQAGDRILIAA